MQKLPYALRILGSGFFKVCEEAVPFMEEHNLSEMCLRYTGETGLITSRITDFFLKLWTCMCGHI